MTPGSLAQKLGGQSRDVILRIDGLSIRTAADVVTSLRKAGKTVKVVVDRQGQELTLEAPVPERDPLVHADQKTG